jgi:WG containing repeat
MSQIQKLLLRGAAAVLLLVGVAIGQTPVVASTPIPAKESTLLHPVVSAGKIGFIDSSLRLVIPYRFDYAGAFSEGLAYVQEEGRCGYVDVNGNVLFAEKRLCSLVHFDFSEGLAAFEFATNRKGKSYLRHRLRGYLDRTGKIVIPPRFFNAGDFHEGLAAVNEKIDDKFGYIDSNGKYVIPPTFDYASDFSEGLAAVSVGQRCGYIDHAGRFSMPAFIGDAHGCGPFRGGLALAGSGDMMGVIDSSGHYIIPAQHATAWEASSEGLIGFFGNSQHGFFDNSGKLIIETSPYNEVHPFSEGLAAVGKDYKWGYINQRGELVIPLQFDRAFDFMDGLAMVSTDEGWVYIDKSGKVVWKGAYY